MLILFYMTVRNSGYQLPAVENLDGLKLENIDIVWKYGYNFLAIQPGKKQPP